MSNGKGCILVVDDDQAMRESLESLFRSVGHATRLFASAQEFLAAELPDMPCCLVLDVRLPNMSGLEFQRELKRQDIAIPVVFVTGHGDVPMSVAAMKAGAIEFLTKPFREQELLDSVHRGLAIDGGRRRALADLGTLKARQDLLSPRERDVMARVVAGQANKQIAAELDLSEVTVKAHRAQVMRKMQARNLPDLVRFADRLTIMD